MYLQDVIKAFEKFASTKYAADWDNVGLLIEPSFSQHIKHILLTNDLTLNVVDEAIENKANVILSYHPPIFSGLKVINQSSVKGQIVSRCLENKIAVYSPHTAFDVMQHGVNDWLIKPLAQYASNIEPIKSEKQDINILGWGRILYLKKPHMSIYQIICIMKEHLNLKMLRLALGRSHDLDTLVESLACCAGSGGNILQNAAADLYLTGEMSHHNILDATEKGITVLLTEHSNSERGFLADIVKPKLTEVLGPQIIITVSTLDKDPIEIV